MNKILLTLVGLLVLDATQTWADEVAALRPNVLFIAVDDLNDWAFDLNDDIQAKTPNLNLSLIHI